MRQDLFFAKKKEMGSPPSMEVYKQLIDLVPQIKTLLAEGEVQSDVKTASDWSYSASAYAGPNFRLVGDAGCFIDPYFSSGVHLALASGLSAAMTIQASRKGMCSEFNAASWHTHKVAKGYTRFLLIVMTILRQLRKQNQAMLSDDGEDGFDSAFGFIQPGMYPFLTAKDVSAMLTTPPKSSKELPMPIRATASRTKPLPVLTMP